MTPLWQPQTSHVQINSAKGWHLYMQTDLQEYEICVNIKYISTTEKFVFRENKFIFLIIDC